MPTEDDFDPDAVFQRVAKLYDSLLGEAEYILKAGSRQNKIALIKAVVPAMMKEMAAREDSSSKEEAAKALTQLFSDTRGQIKARPELPTDMPDGPDTVR